MKPPTLKIELFKGKTLADGRHPVCIRVTSKGKVKRKSIASAFVKEWDRDRIKSKSRKDHEELNDHITREYTKYKLIFNELKEKDFYPEDVFKDQKIASPFFVANAREYLKTLRPHSFNASYSRLKKILRYTDERDFRFSEINERWIKGFKKHCKDKEKNIKGEKGNSDNTVNTALKFIGRIASFAGVKIELPVLTFTKTIKQKLTIEELIKFDAVQSKPLTHEWHAKNTFMLQYYFWGMRIGDLLTLKWPSIVDDRLIYDTSKTGHAHFIKIRPAAKEILEHYKGGVYILPWIRGDHDGMQLAKEIKNRTAVINWHLKEIAKKAGIIKNISTHIARHSFASISDTKLKGDIKSIQGMLGHGSRRQTEDYINDLRNSDELDEAADRIFD